MSAYMYSSLEAPCASKIKPVVRGAEKMASARCCPVVSPLLLLTLLACAAAAAAEWSVCQDANCGKGHCAEVPGVIPTYKCQCDPGWSQPFSIIPISPCTIPNCTFDSSCFNITLEPPRGIPITDICVAVTCGPGGTCKKGSVAFTYTCECQPGYNNMLNLTAMPCVKNCKFGADCTQLGVGQPPKASPPSPAPPGNQESSGAPPGAPLSPKGTATAIGSVSLRGVMQMLLLVSVAMVLVL